MAKCRVKANICGLEYILSSEDSESYVRAVVEKVSEHIDKIMKENEKLSVPMAATLTALNFCDAAQKANDNSDYLRTQIKDYLEDLAKCKEELEVEKKRCKKIESDLESLKNQLEAHPKITEIKFSEDNFTDLN